MADEPFDPRIELLRNAQNLGRPSGDLCGVCGTSTVLLTTVFGQHLPSSGRCISKLSELDTFDSDSTERTAYVSEVCPACGWNYLVRRFAVGAQRARRFRRADVAPMMPVSAPTSETRPDEGAPMEAAQDQYRSDDVEDDPLEAELRAAGRKASALPSPEAVVRMRNRVMHARREDTDAVQERLLRVRGDVAPSLDDEGRRRIRDGVAAQLGIPRGDTFQDMRRSATLQELRHRAEADERASVEAANELKRAVLRVGTLSDEQRAALWRLDIRPGLLTEYKAFRTRFRNRDTAADSFLAQHGHRSRTDAAGDDVTKAIRSLLA